MVIQISTTVDDAMHAEVKRRGLKWSNLIDLGFNLQVKGQSIETDNVNLREANAHLRYTMSDKDLTIAALNSQIEQLQRGKWPTLEEANGIHKETIKDEALGELAERKATDLEVKA